MPHPHTGGIDSSFAISFSQIKMLRKTPGSPASITFELVESGFLGFPKQHTWNAAHCSKLFKHSKKKKKKESEEEAEEEGRGRFSYLV